MSPPVVSKTFAGLGIRRDLNQTEDSNGKTSRTGAKTFDVVAARNRSKIESVKPCG